MNIHSVDWSILPRKTVRAGAEQKAFSGTGATIALHRLQPGHQPKPHRLPNEQIAYIVSGHADFHIGDQVIRLGPGGLVVVPPNVLHHAVVVGEEVVINIDVFTPSRHEYA